MSLAHVMPPLWSGDPFHPISAFYKQQFGERVQVIPISVATDCPNRRGLKGMETCVFCDPWGSAAYPELQGQSAKAQLDKKIPELSGRYRARKQIVYLQAYTNSFISIEKLREAVAAARCYDSVVGINIGTRPDCLSKAFLEFLEQTSQEIYTSVELGVQSLFDHHLEYLRRGHSAEVCFRAFEDLANVDVPVGMHLIFGLPNETMDEIKQTADMISKTSVSFVKLHHLHVLKDTALETLYREGKFRPIALDEYSARTVHFLQHLSPNIAVQRLSAVCNRWEELVAPDWTRSKLKVRQHIVKTMLQEGAYQGQYFVPASSEGKALPLAGS